MNIKIVEILPFIETLMTVVFGLGFLSSFVLFYFGMKNKNSFALYDSKPFRRKSYKMLKQIYDQISDEEKKRSMLRLMKYHRFHMSILNIFFVLVLFWIFILMVKAY